MANLIEELKRRDFIQDVTPGLAERLGQGAITGYVGFDPTADSLHVGNLVPVMALSWLQRLGGTPIVLVGGGTGFLDDPTKLPRYGKKIVSINLRPAGPARGNGNAIILLALSVSSGSRGTEAKGHEAQ